MDADEAIAACFKAADLIRQARELLRCVYTDNHNTMRDLEAIQRRIEYYANNEIN